MSNAGKDAQELTGPLSDQMLRGAEGWCEPPASGPEDAVLVAYLSGTLAAAEAQAVERGLVRHTSVRRRLPAIAARLSALQAAPWAEVEAAGDEVARAWRALAETRLGTTPTVRSQWAAQGWEILRGQAAAGVAEAQEAWVAFLSFADQWGRERSVLQFAAARGAAVIPQDSGSLPPGVAVTVEAAVEENGDLTAHLWTRDRAGFPSGALDSRAARLALASGGDRWPLAERVVRHGEAAWHLPGGGAALGLFTGPVTGLVVTFGAPPVPAASAVRVLFAGDAAARILLHGAPHRETERMHLTLALPALTRATQAGRRLVVSVVVTPGKYQRLGAWPVSDWGEEPRRVEAPCSGPNGDLDTTALRLDLEPIAPE